MKARKKNLAYIPSGSAAQCTPNNKGFRYYEQMSFLNDYTNYRAYVYRVGYSQYSQ